MNIIEMGVSLLSEKLGLDLDPNAVAPALNGLLANDSGELDLAGLASKMASSGNLSAVIGSWLGDGANDAISPESIMSLFGGDKLGAFAQQLGVSSDEAASGLAATLPEMIDKASSGGSLLDLAGGAGGLLGAASSFFKK
ncbi:MAG: YidB family protein [Pseudomonadota bacterium]|mgnify:CR=1 FL=1